MVRRLRGQMTWEWEKVVFSLVLTAAVSMVVADRMAAAGRNGGCVVPWGRVRSSPALLSRSAFSSWRAMPPGGLVGVNPFAFAAIWPEKLPLSREGFVGFPEVTISDGTVGDRTVLAGTEAVSGASSSTVGAAAGGRTGVRDGGNGGAAQFSSPGRPTRCIEYCGVLTSITGTKAALVRTRSTADAEDAQAFLLQGATVDGIEIRGFTRQALKVIDCEGKERRIPFGQKLWIPSED